MLVVLVVLVVLRQSALQRNQFGGRLDFGFRGDRDTAMAARALQIKRCHGSEPSEDPLHRRKPDEDEESEEEQRPGKEEAFCHGIGG